MPVPSQTSTSAPWRACWWAASPWNTAPETPLLWGFSWLALYNPYIDWTLEGRTPTVTHLVFSLPFHLQRAPLCHWSETWIPWFICYGSWVSWSWWEYSKDRALALPPCRSYVCAIDLRPSSALPSWLQGSICSSSCLGVTFFFVVKNNKSLRPCIIFHGLKILMKNKYALPLIQSATIFPIFWTFEAEKAFH